MIPLGMGKLEWCGYPTVKKFEDTFKRFDTIPVCDGQTDGRTDVLPQHSPRYAYTSRGKNYTSEKRGSARCFVSVSS